MVTGRASRVKDERRCQARQPRGRWVRQHRSRVLAVESARLRDHSREGRGQAPSYLPVLTILLPLLIAECTTGTWYET